MYGHGRRGVCDRRRVVMRKEEREGNRGDQLKVVVVESAPLSSLAMIGGTTDRGGSASSAGRTWRVAATGRWVCSLDRLTPTRWPQARRVSQVTVGTSSATIGLSSCPDCCNKEVPDEHGMWVGSASRPDHLRRLGGGLRRGVARPSVAARPSALPAMVDQGPRGPGQGRCGGGGRGRLHRVALCGRGDHRGRLRGPCRRAGG